MIITLIISLSSRTLLEEYSYNNAQIDYWTLLTVALLIIFGFCIFGMIELWKWNPWWLGGRRGRRQRGNRWLAYQNKEADDKAKAKVDFTKTIASFSKTIELNPEYAEAYFKRGNIYSRNNNFNEAIADFTKAIELNPEYAEAYDARAVAYTYSGEYAKAITDFAKAKELGYESISW